MATIERTIERTEVSLLVVTSSIIGILACLGDVAMTYVLATWYPGYRSLYQPMSDLGDPGSPVFRITSTWWVIMGLMFVVFAGGFYKAFSGRGRPGRMAAWMIAFYGIGEGLGSGLVPGTPGIPFRTPGSIAHNILGGVGVTSAIFLPFAIMKLYRTRRSPCLIWYSWFTTVAECFFLALFGISTFYHPEGNWISYSGLWQRLFMLIYYSFIIWLALLMLRSRKTSSV